MAQRRSVFYFAATAIAVFVYFILTTTRDATTLFINGSVYTFDKENSVTEAVAVRGSRIVGVGTTAELVQRFKADSVVDLHGAMMMPGLIDAHAHLKGLGQYLESLILLGAPSPGDIVRLVEARVRETVPGTWIKGRGWDQNLWERKEFPTASVLDAVAPDHPVVLIRIDGHAIWVNSAAMKIAGITKETKDPEGGKIIRDAAGNPTGIFVEDKARNLIESFIPPTTEHDIEESILRAANECVKVGLTEVGEMGVDSIEIAVLKKLASEGRLPIRVYGAISVPSPTWLAWMNRDPLIGFGNGMFTLRAMKMYADGALGSRGAALVEEYSDDPGNRGTTTTSERELDEQIRVAVQRGYQPCVHAIGDRANNMALNAYEKVLASVPSGDYRPRIEHVQVLLSEDIPRFARLGVLPSMQPVHATSDMYWAEARLGSRRISGAYAWRSLMNAGSNIVSGSDFPNDGMNPLWGFYAAITRSDRTGYPADGWYREQKMTRLEAARSYTSWAAYASFEEHEKGTIETGKWADLTILSNDIMKIPPAEILTTDVVMTIVAGRVVYENQSLPVRP